MALVHEGDVVRFDGHCSVEEALPLLDRMNETPSLRVALADCETLHTALLQVLAAARPEIVSMPANPMLAALVERLVREPR
jgi:hypothetical protein